MNQLAREQGLEFSKSNDWREKCLDGGLEDCNMEGKARPLNRQRETNMSLPDHRSIDLGFRAIKKYARYIEPERGRQDRDGKSGS